MNPTPEQIARKIIDESSQSVYEKLGEVRQKEWVDDMTVRFARALSQSAEAATLAALPRWIPVSERLPEEAEMVWVYQSWNAVCALYLDNGKGPVWYVRENQPISTVVEFWMPRVKSPAPASQKGEA